MFQSMGLNIPLTLESKGKKMLLPPFNLWIRRDTGPASHDPTARRTWTLECSTSMTHAAPFGQMAMSELGKFWPLMMDMK
jgi:hypothetical protein